LKGGEKVSNPNKEREEKIQDTTKKIIGDDSISSYLRTILVWLICENEKRRKDHTDDSLRIGSIEKLLKEKGFYKGI